MHFFLKKASKQNQALHLGNVRIRSSFYFAGNNFPLFWHRKRAPRALHRTREAAKPSGVGRRSNGNMWIFNPFSAAAGPDVACGAAGDAAGLSPAARPAAHASPLTPLRLCPPTRNENSAEK